MMRFHRIGLGLALVLLVISIGYLTLPSNEDRGFYANVGQILSDDQGSEGFARAIEPVELRFPEDAGPHLPYQTEWWYYTGNLSTKEGRHFGYQLTFFRRAVRPEPGVGGSAWRTNQVYFAHFALTDVAAARFHAFERFSRGALELAGAQSAPYRVWLEDWEVKTQDHGYRLRARESDLELNLDLTYLKPVVLHGEKGLSRKSEREGNASYYYSQSRIASRGTVAIGATRYDVEGLSWLDHEWSTSALEKNQVGWDWFSIQLDDGRELMLFRIRQRDGKNSAFSAGSLIDASGQVTRLKQNEFTLTPLAEWTSPVTKAVYPVVWAIAVPGQKLSLRLDPYLKDQEHRHSFAYWEGAVRLSGNSLSGDGYVEMTGYHPLAND